MGAYYWEDRYERDSYCVFCRKKTDNSIEYNYHGVGLDVKKFIIPVHLFCYLKEKLKIIFSCVLSFLSIFSFELFLMCNIFFGRIFLPVWYIVICIITALFFTAWIGIKVFIIFEDKIADYKKSHTNYEDYYKSDRLRWKR